MFLFFNSVWSVPLKLGRRGGAEVSLIRAELVAAVEKSGRERSRTYVAIRRTESLHPVGTRSSVATKILRCTHRLAGTSGGGALAPRAGPGLCNGLARQAFPDLGEGGATVDSLGAKTIMSRPG